MNIPAFPLPIGHWYGTYNDSRDSGECHTGYGYEAIQLRKVQHLLGIEPTGQYDTATQRAVLKFQHQGGLDLSGHLDEKVWNALWTP
jgi:peptidoglycan hydrolase-like protein with peptidoglycan-binding domain